MNLNLEFTRIHCEAAALVELRFIKLFVTALPSSSIMGAAASTEPGVCTAGCGHSRCVASASGGVVGATTS
jgi:hypothetical protein